jgi:rfaE bifunctional protein nucleotidyltransferase chain/domain
MNWQQIIEDKIFAGHLNLANSVTLWKDHNEVVVFTNGCFDLLHLGHIDYLSKAAELGDRLIIGLNSDASVSRLKGENRPIFDYTTRATKLASLVFVDAVVMFEQDTPLDLITALIPNVLVKGGDYSLDEVVGAQHVVQSGGRVELIPFLEGHSSTSYIEKIRKD